MRRLCHAKENLIILEKMFPSAILLPSVCYPFAIRLLSFCDPTLLCYFCQLCWVLRLYNFLHAVHHKAQDAAIYCKNKTVFLEHTVHIHGCINTNHILNIGETSTPENRKGLMKTFIFGDNPTSTESELVRPFVRVSVRPFVRL